MRDIHFDDQSDVIAHVADGSESSPSLDQWTQSTSWISPRSTLLTGKSAVSATACGRPPRQDRFYLV